MAALAIVIVRRFWKQRYFLARDEQRLEAVAHIEEALEQVRQGRPAPRPAHARLAEEELLRRLPTASAEERMQIRMLFHEWGLVDDRLLGLQRGPRWERAESAIALGRMQAREALPDLIALLPRARGDLQVAVLNALELLGEPEAIDPLVEFLAQADSPRDHFVLSALVRCARNHPALLLPHLRHSWLRVRVMVAATLAEVASSHELVALVEAASDPEPEVRAKVARALGRTAEPGAFEPLRHLAHDAVWYVRLQALGALAHIHLPEVHDVLLYGTADKDWRVRGKAATALYRFVNDPIYLLGRLQEELADRYAIDALIAVLEREGIIWQAINSLRSPMVLVRESSRELIVELILAGKFAAVLYALEMHPERSIRQELLSLVNEHSGLSILAPLGDLLESRTLDGETRRGIEELFARWKG